MGSSIEQARAMLAKKLPGVRFEVHEVTTGDVCIRWIDGPTGREVEREVAEVAIYRETRLVYAAKEFAEAMEWEEDPDEPEDEGQASLAGFKADEDPYRY